MSTIPIFDLSPQSTGGITRLYEHLELFSEGTPPQHTLFVLGRPTLAERNPLQATPDQLLIIDPPADLATRFRLDGDVALLSTGEMISSDFPRMQTEVGGVAHIRVGMHYLDIYSQQQHNVIHLPALGIICGGGFGSDTVVPVVGESSDGSEELETLRLLAQLVKGRTLQMYIPHVGELCQERMEAMQRLAADVAYLHEVRRTLTGILERGESEEVIETIVPRLLPSQRSTESSAAVHQENVQRIYRALARPEE